MMITMNNEILSLTVDTLGAQLMSLKHQDGTEYLWQGDPETWNDRAPNLFPFIGRLTNNSYRYRGQVYPMTIHGFAAASEFVPVDVTNSSVTMELTANAATREQYPFDFVLQITYTLVGNDLQIRFRVSNRDDKTMPFAIGGHPGFRVPLVNGERFEDYTLEFSQPCQADRVGFTKKLYLSGVDEAYLLEEDVRIRLHHRLFDEDAIVLKNMTREITLRSEVSGRGVRVAYPDFSYLGIWHWPQTQVPYVCIEPWTSLPSRQDVVEEFTCKSDMIQLKSGGVYDTTWTVTVF